MSTAQEPGVPSPQDAASGVVDEMWTQVLDQIPDEDKPVVVHDPDGVGHIFDGDEAPNHSDVTVWADSDMNDLSSEEAAMHYVDEDAEDDDEDADPDLTPELRRELEEF